MSVSWRYAHNSTPKITLLCVVQYLTPLLRIIMTLIQFIN